MTLTRRILFTLLLLFLTAAILWSPSRGILFENSVFRQMDQVTDTYLDEALVNAAAAFAIARAANSFISLLQESQVQATLLGTGVTLAAGQVLDPVNDLIERFSWVMLASMTSLGIQQFAVHFGTWVSIRIILVPALIMLLVGPWLPWSSARHLFMTTGGRLIVAAIIIRLFIPLAGWANHHVYRIFLEPEFQTSIENIDTEEFKAERIEEYPFIKDRQVTGATAKLKALRDRMAELSQYIINLIIVFVIQNALLPLTTLYVLLKSLQYLARAKRSEAF
jgi:hypothetical protein